MATKGSAQKPSAGDDGRISVTQYLRGQDPLVRPLLREVIKVAREVGGEMEERAYRAWGIWLISDRGDVSMSGLRDRVNVRMRASAADHDRRGLLRGTGKSRYVPVRSLEDAQSDGLRELLRHALATGPRRLRLNEGRGKQILERVRRICLDLPNAEERLSHGTPTFFVRGKQFAQVWAGHHDDHGLQLWCAAPGGAQSTLVKADPGLFFIPPYLGSRGWLGVRLERPDWPEIERVIEDGHALIAGVSRTRY